MKSPYETLRSHLESSRRELKSLDIELELSRVFKDLDMIIRDQYSADTMIKVIKEELYPPRYIYDRLKQISDRRDKVFKRVLPVFREKCFNSSGMWSQSNTDIFDFMHRYKDIK